MASRLAAEILMGNLSKHKLKRGRRAIRGKTTKGKGEMIAYIGPEGPGGGSTLINHQPSGGSTLSNA